MLTSLFNNSKALGASPVSSEVFIVAEIGKNFIQTVEDKSPAEYLENAKVLVKAAAAAGADAVKFQTHQVDDEQAPLDIVSPHFTLADRYQWLKRNTLATPDWFWTELQQYANRLGLVFFSTPMSVGAARKLSPLNLPLWKVGSGDADDFLLLDYLMSTGKPIIISSGMVSRRELQPIMKRLRSHKPGIGLLYCVSQYPCPPERFNLTTMAELAHDYPWATIGFSDHSVDDMGPALAAVKLGARVIEKHFSLGRHLWGPDHKASLTPDEFASLVSAIRSGAYHQVDSSRFLGQPGLELEGANNQFRPYFKKTLVAARDLLPGVEIVREQLQAWRPRLHLAGLPADALDQVLGQTSKRLIRAGEAIQSSDLTSRHVV